MWSVISLENIDCKKICNIIQKDLLNKINQQKIPTEGKFLYIEIKESTVTIEPENPRITKN